MKVLITIAAILLVVNANEHLEKLNKAEQVAQDCIKETGVDPEIATELKNANFANRNEKAECFVKCLYEKIGFMDKEGNIFKDVFLQTAQGDAEKKKAAEDLINTCINKENDNKCALAYNIFECYWTARKTSLAEEFKRIKEAITAAEVPFHPKSLVIPVPAPAPGSDPLPSIVPVPAVVPPTPAGDAIPIPAPAPAVVAAPAPVVDPVPAPAVVVPEPAVVVPIVAPAPVVDPVPAPPVVVAS